jgi:hypothetical protein
LLYYGQDSPVVTAVRPGAINGPMSGKRRVWHSSNSSIISFNAFEQLYNVQRSIVFHLLRNTIVRHLEDFSHEPGGTVQPGLERACHQNISTSRLGGNVSESALDRWQTPPPSSNLVFPEAIRRVLSGPRGYFITLPRSLRLTIQIVVH